MWRVFIMQIRGGPICIPYISVGENLQILPHSWAMVRPSLRNNGQAIMFYSCDLFVCLFIYLFIYLFIFRSLIFQAEEHRPAGPLPECRHVV